MKTHGLLISGTTIVSDRTLAAELSKHLTVIQNTDNAHIKSIVARKKIDLILMEISAAPLLDMEILRHLNKQHPNICVLLVEGDKDSEWIARGLQHGAKDAFRRPYQRQLIVERVLAILQ